jgi:hypothetical protein
MLLRLCLSQDLATITATYLVLSHCGQNAHLPEKMAVLETSGQEEK